MGKAVHSYSAFDISRAGESLNISYSENVHSSHERKKARRLTMEQTRALENSFELGKIPEAGRKEELAGALGLQPTQIAIWFQNRRAKWKTAQLEKDYRSLNQNYGSLKAQYHTLLEENKKLRSEIQRSGSISKNGQSRHDKEVMGDGQTDFNTVQEKKVECYSVHNAEDNIRHQVCIEENCGHNALVAIEEEDCYRNMGGVSSFMFEDHWTPGFH